MLRVLLVDDDPSARRVLLRCMGGVGEIEVHEAGSLAAARQALGRHLLDAVLIDLCLDGSDPTNRDGLVLVREVREQTGAAPIVVTVAGEMEEIRRAMRLGAYAYILKDELDEELVVPVLAELRDRRALERQVLDLHGLVGTSAVMERLRRTIRRVADADGPVLILGPTGSGKELVAAAIHALGPRRERPLVPVNCGAIPESLAEAMLFGHEKGNYTGADRARIGLLAEVADGTLFLDEVAELSLPLQAKLLRVLENRTFRVLGASSDTRFGGHVLAATHVDLDARRKEGRFRDDLYYRLDALAVRVPPLDDHKEDIPALVEHFTRKEHRRVRFADEALAVLARMRWPGNVRELRNLVHRLAVLVEWDVVRPEDVEEHRGAPQRAGDGEAGAGDAPGLLAGLSLRGSKKHNGLRLAQNQIRMLEAEGLSMEEICRILGVSRASFFRLKAGMDEGQNG